MNSRKLRQLDPHSDLRLIDPNLHIRLEVPDDYRVDHIQRAINELIGLEFKNYSETEQGLNDILFDQDRVDLLQIKEFRNKLKDFSNKDIFSTDLFIWSSTEVRGKLIDIRARLREALIESRIFLQIPRSSRYDKRDILEAFKVEQGPFEGQNRVEIETNRNNYILTPHLDEKFSLVNFGKVTPVEVSRKLRIPEEEMIYVAGFQSTPRGETLGE